jgi:hypothetical protein
MATAKSRLIGPALVATGPTTLLTAGATEQVVIQMIMVSNPTNSAVNFTMSIGADAAGTRIIGTNATVGNIAANSVQQFYGTWPVQPAEIVTASASTNNVLVLTVGGERRTLG